MSNAAGCGRDWVRVDTAAASEIVAAEVFAISAAAATAAALAAVEEHKLAPEPLEHDFGRVAVIAAIVGPFAGLDLPFEIDLAALAQIILRELGRDSR